MIISASRRTDIPALYSEWFMNRLKAGYAFMPNPRNSNRLGRVELSPSTVDCIVFWTKNPIPMLNKLEQIDMMGYSYYFQFTLTPYDKRIEDNLPSKDELLRAFAELTKRIGVERVVWRYDPIIVDATYTVKWHWERFAEMCEKLHPYTRRCVISFIDAYKNMGSGFRVLTQNEMSAVVSGFSETAKKHDLALYTCAEDIELTEYGIGHSSCIDQELIEDIIGCPLAAKKDANQRPACQCIESVDIGVYDTCTNGCTYCYATSRRHIAQRRFAEHDPNAAMILGNPAGDEIVTDRTTPSQKYNQLRLFKENTHV